MVSKMKKKKPSNKLMVFPENKMFQYLRTGKFKALSSDWKHERIPLEFDYELFVVTEGTLYLRYMEEDFVVKSGEYLILPPSKSVREGFKKEYCAFYWIHFTMDNSSFPMRINAEDAESYKRASCFLLPQTSPIPRPAKIAVQMKQLQDLDRNNYPDITLNALCTAIITELFGQLSSESIGDEDPIGRKQIYSDIADYVRRNIEIPLTVNDIAEAFGYSSKYLSHLFSELSGSSLKAFIMSQKIDAASFYLTDSDQTITEIASNLGFSDVHNFSRAFKRMTGLTPSAYRDTYTKRLLYHK